MKRFIGTSLLAFAAVAASAQTKINPGTQIKWPTGSTGCVYASGSNTCVTNVPTATTAGGAPPTGSAGGDLSGSYPNPTVAKVNGASVPASKTIVGTNSSGQIVDASSATLANSTTGNAATATALAATPTTCSTGQAPVGVTAAGDATGCFTPTGTGINQLTGDVTAGPGSGSQAASVVKVNGAAVPASKTLVGTNSSSQLVDASGATLANDTTGNAATATALAATPTQCTGTQFAQGIAASGNANCATPSGSGSGLAGTNNMTASYLLVSGDNNKSISFNCLTACTATLPTSVPASPWTVFIADEGLAALSVIPTSGANIYTSLGVPLGTGSLNPGMGVSIWSDGANYHVNQGGIMTGGAATPVLVQSVTAQCGSDPCPFSYASDVSPGSALVFECQHGVTGGCATGVTDNHGDTFVLTNTQSIGSAFEFAEWVACNAHGGPTTITPTDGGSAMAAYEVANTAATSCVDAYSSAHVAGGGSNSTSTGSITTTQASDFILVSGATRCGLSGCTADSMTEANSYTAQISFVPSAATVLKYQSWNSIQLAAGSVSDTLTASAMSASGNLYAGILALKPAASSSAFVEGDVPAIGPGGNQQPLHAGTNGYCWTSNGPLTMPSYQPCSAAFPIGAPVLATNSLGAPIAATAHQVVTPIECVDTSSSSSAYTCAPTPAVSSLSSGDTFILSGINQNNAAGTVTLKIGTATAATVSKWQNSGTTLAAGDLQGGATARLTYDGTYLELDTIGNPPAGITYTGASPIVVAGGAISCPTCGTTSAAPYVAQYTYVVYSATGLASITSPAITTVAGDLVTVECQVATGAGITVGISDSKSNSWTTYSQINTASPSMVMGWSVLTTGGSTTFTCTPNSSQGGQAMVVLDIKNASTATVVGHANTTTNSSPSNLFNNFAIAPSGRSADVWCGAMNGSAAFYLGYIGGVPAQIAGVAASAIGTAAYDTCIFAVVPQATGQLPFYATWSSGNELTSAMIGFNY